jgi:hypothetical protein
MSCDAVWHAKKKKRIRKKKKEEEERGYVSRHEQLT